MDKYSRLTLPYRYNHASLVPKIRESQPNQRRRNAELRNRVPFPFVKMLHSLEWTLKTMQTAYEAEGSLDALL